MHNHTAYPPMALERLQNGWSHHSQSDMALQIQYLAVCESTNALLYSRAHHPNTLLVTEQQINGKGQFERTWLSQSGDLTFSLGLNIPMAQLAALSLKVGLAIAQMFAQRGTGLQLKWPNDIIATHPDTSNQGKLAGILVQSLPDVAQQSAWVVIGVGLNIAPRLMPAGAQGFAPIGLAQIASNWVAPEVGAREALIVALVDAILQTINAASSANLAPEWNAHDLWHQQSVRLTKPDGAHIEGIGLGINSSGAYQVMQGSQIHTVQSGQLSAPKGAS